MGFIGSNILVTKAVDVTFHQDVLLEMKQHPERIKEVVANKNGRLVVEFTDGRLREIGVLQNKYWNFFGRLRVLSHALTGGYPLPDQVYSTSEGTITKLAYIGCNLQLKVD